MNLYANSLLYTKSQVRKKYCARVQYVQKDKVENLKHGRLNPRDSGKRSALRRHFTQLCPLTYPLAVYPLVVFNILITIITILRNVVLMISLIVILNINMIINSVLQSRSRTELVLYGRSRCEVRLHPI